MNEQELREGMWCLEQDGPCPVWVLRNIHGKKKYSRKQDQRDKPRETPDHMAILGYLQGPGGLISPLGAVAREKVGPWDEEGRKQLEIRTI